MHLSNYFEELIQIQMKKTKGQQMTEEEYRYISSFLGNINFLVFGCGVDSQLWNYCNQAGLTVFLEDNPKWINPEDKNVFEVKYTTKRPEYKDLLKQYQEGNYINLTMKLPEIVKSTKWDAIFIDAPNGHKDTKPGRMQSIFTASKLANSNTEIFLHDCDRDIEDIYSKEMFSLCLKQLTKLRHLRV